ncbi:MAG: APC family permease [Nocardioides sp.]|uniref:APC family permease n=1 Tax=Nocardioides sp. TaxID=35761 RepID=UPI003F0CFBF5
MSTEPSLARHLGTRGATLVGLGAMLGAGVFVAWGPAAQAAGSWLVGSLTIAGALALCHATASAQLASAHPASGGSYLFGRVVLGPWWGFCAGWGFVVGKTASCAAMAMAFAAYLLPAQPAWQPVAAVLAVVALSVANLRGITRTATVATVLVAVTLCVLVGFVVVVRTAGPPHGVVALAPGDARGLLQGAGLLFFTFAGYARIATLAEEVRRPEVLGRAIGSALGITAAVYLAVGTTVLAALGAAVTTSTAPLADATQAVGADWASGWVRLGAVTASLGALLALLAGVGRTMLAMAREADLPRPLAHVDPVHRVPDRAQLAVAAAVVALVCLVDLRGAIGFSSFGVLVYYFVANAAAFAQPAHQRRWPRALQVAGMTGCVVLSATLPPTSLGAGLLVLAIGLVGRWLVLRRR